MYWARNVQGGQNEKAWIFTIMFTNLGRKKTASGGTGYVTLIERTCTCVRDVHTRSKNRANLTMQFWSSVVSMYGSLQESPLRTEAV